MTQRAAPKYQAIAASIRREIKRGKLQPGEKIYTEKEIGDRFGVSRMTAINAVKTLLNEGLVHRRQGSGTFVSDGSKAERGYESASVIESRVVFDNPVAGVVGSITERAAGRLVRPAAFIASKPDGTTVELLAAIQSELSRVGLPVCVDFPDSESAVPERLAHWFSHHIDSAIVVRASSREDSEDRLFPDSWFNDNPVDARLKHVILLGSVNTGQHTPPPAVLFDRFAADNRFGIRQVIDRLAQSNRNRIAFVGRPPVTLSAESSRAAFVQSAGSRTSSDLIFQTDVTPRALDALRQVFSLSASARPDAIVCADNDRAAALLNVLNGLGLRIPDDAAVVCLEPTPCFQAAGDPVWRLRLPIAQWASDVKRAIMTRAGGERLSGVESISPMLLSGSW